MMSFVFNSIRETLIYSQLSLVRILSVLFPPALSTSVEESQRLENNEIIIIEKRKSECPRVCGAVVND